MDTSSPPVELHVDALLPSEMARRAEDVGVRKATLPAVPLFALAVLAGVFIALGGMFSTTAVAGAAGVLPVGLTRVIGGATFALGLLLVVVGGAELFTGNNLMVMAWAARRITVAQVLRNWGIVYAGNFVGAVGTAVLVFVSGQYRVGNGAVGMAVLGGAHARLDHGFAQAVALGVLCNVLVCLAVWLTFSARSTTDRAMVVLPPVTAFVAAGFEHCVANMYSLPLAWLVRTFAPGSFWDSVGSSPGAWPLIEWDRILVGNLLPVTLGNLVGGAWLVGLTYWFIYLRSR